MNLQKLNKSLTLFIVFISLATLINAQETENVYIMSGEITNDTVNIDPFFYLGSGYSEDNGSIASNYSVLFYNESDLIKTFNFTADWVEWLDEIFFFSVDVPNETKVIKFKNQTDIIKTFDISQNAPSISELNIVNINEDTYSISWSASDADGDNLTYSVYFSTDNKTTWDFLVLDINETSTILNFTFFPGGNYFIKVVASDGFNLGESIYNETLTISNKPPYVFITSPPSDSVFSNSTNISNITFEGWAYDPELGELNEIKKVIH